MGQRPTYIFTAQGFLEAADVLAGLRKGEPDAASGCLSDKGWDRRILPQFPPVEDIGG